MTNNGEFALPKANSDLKALLRYLAKAVPHVRLPRNACVTHDPEYDRINTRYPSMVAYIKPYGHKIHAASAIEDLPRQVRLAVLLRGLGYIETGPDEFQAEAWARCAAAGDYFYVCTRYLNADHKEIKLSCVQCVGHKTEARI
jgi:hypothetical protein